MKPPPVLAVVTTWGQTQGEVAAGNGFGVGTVAGTVGGRQVGEAV